MLLPHPSIELIQDRLSEIEQRIEGVERIVAQLVSLGSLGQANNAAIASAKPTNRLIAAERDGRKSALTGRPCRAPSEFTGLPEKAWTKGWIDAKYHKDVRR